MEDLVCRICFFEYESDTVIPRVLECGHSFCAICIKEIINSTTICPGCRKSITRSNVENFPINFSLLSIIECLNEFATAETHLKNRLCSLKNKYESMASTLAESKLQLDYYLSIIDNGLADLQELMKNQTAKLDLNATNLKILELIKNIEIVERRSSPNSCSIKNSITLSSNEMKNSECFIQHVYNTINAGEELFAVTKVEEEVKFARLTVNGSKLMCHAFGPPIDKTGMKTIWFQDLKQCMKGNCRAFLEVVCNKIGLRQTIIMKMVNSSLVPQFLKFCTGEVGPVYKRASFYAGTSENSYARSVMKIDNFMLDGKTSAGNFEYMTELGLKDSYSYQQMICTGWADGSFQILKLTHNTQISDAIGIVEDPLDIDLKIVYDADLNILDCGVLIDLNLIKN